MRDFASINAYFSEREIDELQAAIDARGADVAARPGRSPASNAAEATHKTGR